MVVAQSFLAERKCVGVCARIKEAYIKIVLGDRRRIGAMKILKLLVIEDDAHLREAPCGASREALGGVKREAIVFEA